MTSAEAKVCHGPTGLSQNHEQIKTVTAVIA